MNTYKTVGICVCPRDNLPDSYDVTVESRRMLWIEDIKAALVELEKLTVPQEEFTLRLARQLKAKVTTVGDHGNVLVISVWGQP